MNILGVALSCILCLSSAAWTQACQICVPFPETTSTDILLAGEAVVLAREDPDRPFHYRAVEVLKGTLDETKIDLFLNSSTRRQLSIFPERSVVLVRTADGEEATWQSVGVADKEFGPLVREILKASPAWEQDPSKRTTFFAKQLGQEHSQIGNLALLEVARAPYAEIRKLGGALSRDQIHAFLKNYRYIEWHALYILLLAQRDDAADHAFIMESFQSAIRYGMTIQLAAWATAALEIEGTKVIDLIENEYFRNQARTPKELTEITKALSVHGTHGSQELRNRIVISYGALLKLNPVMATQIVEDLIAWKRTEYAAQIGKFVADHPLSLDLPTTLRMKAYARRASPPKD